MDSKEDGFLAQEIKLNLGGTNGHLCRPMRVTDSFLKLLACAGCVWAAAFPIQSAPAADPRTRASELIRMSDKDFFAGFFYFHTAAARAQPPLPASDLWLVLQRLETARSKGTEQITHSLHMSYLVRLLARNGTRADFEQWLDFADKLPAEGRPRQYMMNALLDFAARLETEAWRGDPDLGAKLPAMAATSPPGAGAASPELAGAGRWYQAVVSLQPPAPSNAWMTAQANWGFFYDTISQLLHGRATNASEQILRFKWGGWCGTGSDLFEVPHSRALFLALLKENNSAAALATLLRLSGEGYWSLPIPGDDMAWKRQFITKCGLDWETLYAGELVNRPSWSNAGASRALARFGSEKGVRMLVDMAKVPGLLDDRNYLLALGAIIGPTERISTTNAMRSITFNTHWSEMEFVRPLTNAVSPEFQLALIKLLGDKLSQPDVSGPVAETIARILTELRRSEARPALRAGLNSPYARVREKASSALSDFGEHVPAQISRPRVAFRFLAQGQPLTNLPVEFNLQMTGGGSTSSTPHTDSDGTIQIERDLFIDAQRVVTNLVFGPRQLKTLQQPWFKVEHGVPADLARGAS